MMKTMKPGSQLYRLMCLLSVAGEYPVKSLHLLGNKRMYRKLVKEGLSPLTVRNSVTGETISLPRLFNLCGRGRLKTIRLYAGALPILTWFGEGEYYESITHGYSLPMNQSHLDRNHRVGEALAVFFLQEAQKNKMRNRKRAMFRVLSRNSKIYNHNLPNRT